MSKKDLSMMTEDFLQWVRTECVEHLNDPSRVPVTASFVMGDYQEKEVLSNLYYVLWKNDIGMENIDDFIGDAQGIIDEYVDENSGELIFKPIQLDIAGFPAIHAVIHSFKYYIYVLRPAKKLEKEKRRIEKKQIELYQRKQRLRNPIVRIDYITSKDLLPMLMNKNIFPQSNSVPEKQELLSNAHKIYSTDTLSLEQEREFLNGKVYTEDGFIFRDYGKYIIGFDVRLFHQEELREKELELKRDLENGVLFPEAIQNVLENIRLYALAYKIAFIVLAEVDRQKVHRGVVIPKLDIIEKLGKTSNDKQIYADIENALFSLRWISYKYFGYEYTDISRIKTKNPKTKAIGNFIYNIKDDGKNYILDINPTFVGCILYLMGEERLEIPENFRGYYWWTENVLLLDLSTHGQLLLDYLIKESGNAKLNKDGLKCISQKVDVFIVESGINFAQSSKRFRRFIETLKEIMPIIEYTEPSVEDLADTKPQHMFKVNLRIWLKADIKDIDQKIMDLISKKINL